MIYKEETPQGIISINKAVVNQLIQESLKPFQGKLKLSNRRVTKYSPDGILIKLEFSITLGESINDVMNSIMGFLVDAFENSLEVKIDDIVLSLDGVQTKKGNVSPREISLSYREFKEQTETEK